MATTTAAVVANLANATAAVAAPMITAPEQSVVNFAAYMMLQGVFLGTSALFFYQAVMLYREKGNWLCFADCLQLLFWLARSFLIIAFNIAPGTMVDCSWRQYAAGVASSSVIVTVWWLQFIKFQAMYQDRPWVIRITGAICIICLAAVFPFLKTVVKLDSLDHCSVTFDPQMQSAYISTDVFVNLVLSAMFGLAIYKHVSRADSNWTSYAKMKYILTCDVRAAFIDAAAQIVKLALNLSPLPPSQTVFGSHVCDWVKIVSAHWFVIDVVDSQKSSCPSCSGSIRHSGDNSRGPRTREGSQGRQLANTARGRAASEASANKLGGSNEKKKLKDGYDIESGGDLNKTATVLKSNQTLDSDL